MQEVQTVLLIIGVSITLAVSRPATVAVFERVEAAKAEYDLRTESARARQRSERYAVETVRHDP
jgi:hypothetical protein